MKVQMILFDYGNTLVHEEIRRGIQGFQDIFGSIRSNPRGISREEIYQDFLRLKGEALERFHSRNIEYRYVDIFKLLFERYGIRSSLTYEEMTEKFFDRYAVPRPAQGAVDTLEYLKKEGIRTGVISNLSFSEAVLKRRLRRVLGFDMELVIISGEWIFRKPSREIFLVALGQAGLEADQVWYVGDNPYCDMLGAYKAGIKPIYYTSGVENVFLRDHEDIEMDFPVTRITDLRQIIDLVEEKNGF